MEDSKASSLDGVTRRLFLPLAATGVAIPLLGAAPRKKENEKEDEDLPPTEDLMREHGIVERVVGIYHHAPRLFRQQPVPFEALNQAARIVREFVEDYHEKQEEDDVFPRLEKAGRIVGIVKTLRSQHEVGRRITGEILQLTSSAPDDQGKQRLLELMRMFSAMYVEHAGYEDSVVFPAFRKLLTRKQLDELGDKFEDREHKMFGTDGFDKYVDQLGEVEKKLGLSLASFTPRL